MSEPLDVLAVMAHPDDAELLCGGTLIKCSDRGQRVGVLDLTAGESASRGSPEIRAREAARAAEIMGLAERRCARLPDAGLANSHEARRVVVEHLRDLRPRIVVTHATAGRHPDHRRAAAITYDACFLSGLANFDAAGTKHRPLKLVHAVAFRQDEGPPTFVVDVTGQIDRKLEALAAYTSQFEGLTQAGEVFPGGSRSLAEQIRAEMAHCGALIRVAYGEPFRAREAMRVETLGELDVSTF